MIEDLFTHTSNRNEVEAVFEGTTSFGFGGRGNNTAETFTFGVKWTVWLD